MAVLVSMFCMCYSYYYMGSNKKKLKGKTFGRLYVLEESSIKPLKERGTYWLCRCSCGTHKSIKGGALRAGSTVSCGCKKKEYTHSKTHGMSKTRFYDCWQGMHKGCLPTSRNRNRYFDRKITVCAEWSNFESFKKDMFRSYKSELTLDRKDNSKGYCKENCRWVTMQTQVINREGTKLETYGGMHLPLQTICRKLNIPPTTIRGRIKRGMSFKEAIDLSMY